jgi:hypothetical protein
MQKRVHEELEAKYMASELKDKEYANRMEKQSALSTSEDSRVKEAEKEFNEQHPTIMRAKYDINRQITEFKNSTAYSQLQSQISEKERAIGSIRSKKQKKQENNTQLQELTANLANLRKQDATMQATLTKLEQELEELNKRDNDLFKQKKRKIFPWERVETSNYSAYGFGNNPNAAK